MPTVPSTPISAKPALSPVLPTDRLIGLRTPQNQADATLRVGPVSQQDVATALRPLLNLNTNNIVGTDKRVRFQTAAQLAAATDGGDCLDGLNPATLVLGGLAWVEFHPLGYGTTLRLLYDGAPRTPAGSGLIAFRTGDAVAGDTVPVRWVVATGPEVGVTAYPQRPLGYVFALNELVRAYVSDVATEQFFAANAATALPAPTVSAGDANWRAVSPASLPAAVAPLYGLPGTATNGPMTQAASTTALNSRYTNRGAWAASTLYQPNDAVRFNGATYYNAGAAFTSTTAFVPANWVGFGAGLYTTIDYLNETTVIVGSDLLSGIGGKSYLLNGVAPTLFDSSTQAAGAIFYGRLFAFRNVGPGSISIGTGSTGSAIDGATSITMQPGEWLILKSDFAAGGYAKVMRGTTAPPFSAITANQYGTHPAFSTQTALNAYLLGGAATVPTLTTPTFTAA